MLNFVGNGRCSRLLDWSAINFFFCPQKCFVHLSNIFPSCGPGYPDCSLFCPLSRSGQEKGWIWGVAWGVLCMYISPKEVCDGWVKYRGWGWNSGQNEIPPGPNESHYKTFVGNLYEKWAILLHNRGKNIQSLIGWTSPLKQNARLKPGKDGVRLPFFGNAALIRKLKTWNLLFFTWSPFRHHFRLVYTI